jgi:SAM-dependent methyltransferase
MYAMRQRPVCGNRPVSDDVFRIPLYRAMRQFLGVQKAANGRFAEISGRALIDEFGFDPKTVDHLDYPDFDVLRNPSEPESYQTVLADMVIEHVHDPTLAVENIRKMLIPGGWAVITSAFIFPIHTDSTGSGDYFRFSEQGLRELFRNGWTDITTGSWGNELSVYVALHWEILNRSAVGLAAIKEPNNPKYPLMVWAWARKT